LLRPVSSRSLAPEKHVRERPDPALAVKGREIDGAGRLTPPPIDRQSGGEMVNVHNSVIFLPPSTGKSPASAHGSPQRISAEFSVEKVL
jgi:hypothetical protein